MRGILRDHGIAGARILYNDLADESMPNGAIKVQYGLSVPAIVCLRRNMAGFYAILRGYLDTGEERGSVLINERGERDNGKD